MIGLETVELILDIQETFGIAIPDEAAQEIQTVGQLHRTVLDLLRAKGVQPWLSRPDCEQAVWEHISMLAAKLARDVRPIDVTPATRFMEDLCYGG